MKRSLLLTTVAALIALPVQPILAQAGDSAPLDTAQLLAALKQLKEINETGIKNRRTQAYQLVAAAAASPEKAVAFWKDAVKTAQFEGAEREGSQIRDWREGDGEALNDKLAQGAVVLHLRWLALSLQRSSGVEVRQLLPQIIDFAKAVQADALAAEHFQETLEKAKERNDSGKNGMAKKSVGEDQIVKRVHDQIMRTQVGGSVVAKWLQLGDLLGDAGRKQKGSASATSWETTPANVDGIYNSIILPEFRAMKDPRLLDYWDMFLKRETERAAERKLDVEQRDWTQVRRPSILWNRSQDVLLLGYKNRAIGEMFNIVKTFPQHPDAPNWIAQIETAIMPSGIPPVAPTPGTPAAAIPGSVAPPVAIPSATVPTATLVPNVPPAPVAPAAPVTAAPGIRR